MFSRSLILDRQVAFEDEATVTEANKRFEAHIFGKTILPADIRSPVYKAVFASGNSDTFDTFVKLYQETDLHEEKNRILNALGASKDEAMLERVLQFSLSDEVRSQDAVFVIVSVTRSYKGRLLAWQFVKKNYNLLTDRYKSGQTLARIVKSTTENFVGDNFAEDIEKFFETNPTLGIERAIQQSIETVRLNSAWLKRDEKALREFFDNID